MTDIREKSPTCVSEDEQNSEIRDPVGESSVGTTTLMCASAASSFSDGGALVQKIASKLLEWAKSDAPSVDARARIAKNLGISTTLRTGAQSAFNSTRDPTPTKGQTGFGFHAPSLLLSPTSRCQMRSSARCWMLHCRASLPLDRCKSMSGYSVCIRSRERRHLTRP